MKNCKNKLLLLALFLELFVAAVLEHNIFDQVLFITCRIMALFNISVMYNW